MFRHTHTMHHDLVLLLASFFDRFLLNASSTLPVPARRLFPRTFSLSLASSMSSCLDLLANVVSWSTRCVYFVLPMRPNFLTCRTFGRRVRSISASVPVAALKSRLKISWSSSWKKAPLWKYFWRNFIFPLSFSDLFLRLRAMICSSVMFRRFSISASSFFCASRLSASLLIRRSSRSFHALISCSSFIPSVSSGISSSASRCFASSSSLSCSMTSFLACSLRSLSLIFSSSS
mmetsp:Transcript_22731/g.40216  ORF Transcript_22731/g.40216 Transcript_22731/m.40216 type:complete len:233 (-) Transcript_22731:734-1432(-)